MLPHRNKLASTTQVMEMSETIICDVVIEIAMHC